jgi:hypothetical protein
MSLQETTKYTVEIILTTEVGECPTQEEMESLVWKRMGGGFKKGSGDTELQCQRLNPFTGLTVMAVEVTETTGEL